MYRNVFILLLGWIICLPVWALSQITLTSDDEASRIGSLPHAHSFDANDTVGLCALAALSGPGLTWDFSGKKFTASPTTSKDTMFDYPGGAALANDPDFLTATKVIKSVPNDATKATTYSFYKINSEGLWSLGESQDSLGVLSKLSWFSPPLQQFKFPLTYQSTWTSTSTENSKYSKPGESVSITESTVVDSWGTLILPGWAAEPALRMCTQTTTADSSSGVALFSFTSKTLNWFTKSGREANIIADKNQVPLGAAYSIPASPNSVASQLPEIEDILTPRLSNNPVSNGETQLYYTMKADGNAQVSMMDALGHDVRMLQNGRVSAGQNIIPIDASALTPGTYFLHIAAEGTTVTRKVVITR